MICNFISRLIFDDYYVKFTLYELVHIIIRYLKISLKIYDSMLFKFSYMIHRIL